MNIVKILIKPANLLVHVIPIRAIISIRTHHIVVIKKFVHATLSYIEPRIFNEVTHTIVHGQISSHIDIGIAIKHVIETFDIKIQVLYRSIGCRFAISVSRIDIEHITRLQCEGRQSQSQ